MATPAPGMPKLFVDREKIEFLRSLHFSWEDISIIVGVSQKTLQRRAREWGIRTYSMIADLS